MIENSTNKTTKAAFSVDEISQMTTLSKPYLRLRIKDGTLKATRFGRRVLVLKDDLDAFLKKGVEEKI